MKFYQYNELSDIDEHWQFIYTIFYPSGLVRELNPRRGKVENFEYDQEEYECEEDCLIASYNSQLIYTGE